MRCAASFFVLKFIAELLKFLKLHEKIDFLSFILVRV